MTERSAVGCFGSQPGPGDKVDSCAPPGVQKYPLSAIGANQNLREAVPWECRGTVAVAAGHIFIGDEGVGDGFFGGLDDSLKERVDLPPRNERQVVVALGPAAQRITAGEAAGVGGGDRQEDVSRGVAADRARPRQAEADT